MVHIVSSGSTTRASVTDIPIDTNIYTIEIIVNDLAGLYISILMAQTALLDD
jgi:hypothetical protein